MPALTVGILIISDRSSRRERADTSGPMIVEKITNQGWEVKTTLIIPDEIDQISQTLVDWSDNKNFDLILTTGGTGFAPRDVTPEATRLVIQKEVPGLTEAMRSSGMQKTPFAMLSRSVAGIRNRTIIVNLPGNPVAALENLEVISPALPHAVELLRDRPGAEKGHQIINRDI